MPEAGTFFRCYYVIAPLGEGGMSEVYLGYDLPHHRFVALKFLTGVFGTDASAVGRMRREAEIYRHLEHPNVVNLVDTGDLPEGGIFLVQQFLRGSSVREAMQERGGALEPLRAIAVLEDCAAALNIAHRDKIFHRDVKPDNIMIGPDGRGTLFDFGIASAQDSLVTTQAGTIMGTLTYASPEAREGIGTDGRSDTFGLGAVFYEMLTGQIAIQAKTYQEIIEHSVEDVPLPSELDPRIPSVVDGLFQRMMADDPDDRYETLGHLLVEIGKLRLEAPEELQLALFGPPEVRHAEEALAAFREGDLDRAKTTAARLLTNAPEGSAGELQHLMGRIHQQAGHLASAARAYERGLSQDPRNLQMALDYAMLLMEQKDYTASVEVLKELPSVIRGDFLVRSLLDTIRAIETAPASAWEEAVPHGRLAAWWGRLRTLWK